jgi:AAHS family benzoate transporter-like MFS transporter
MNLPAHFNFIVVGLPVLITAIAVALIMNEKDTDQIKVPDSVSAKA